MTALSETKRYQAYPEYKDSGVEWLDDIPKDWCTRRLKHMLESPMSYGANEAAERAVSTEPRYIRITDMNSDGTLKEDTFRSLPRDIASDYLLKDRDILLARSGATVGKSFIYRKEFGDCCFAGYLIKVSCDSARLNSDYAFWFFQSSSYWQYISGSQIQATIQNVSAEKYGEMYISLPEHVEEQTQIANFLDHETAKIDTLIEKQQQLIKLLKEKRQAVISHAVTKGLNPRAPMKDSGVEWLGEVPEHWVASRLKYYTKQIVDGAHFTPTYTESGVPFLRVTDIQGKSIDLSQIKYIPQAEHNELIKRCNPQKGDLLLSKNGTIGVPKLVDWDWDFSIFVSLCLLKFKEQLSAEYAEYFFRSHELKEQIFGLIKQSTVINLHLDKIQNFWFCIPPRTEQDEIVTSLNRDIGKLDLLINKATDAINLMKERRAALISAAVTGKIDVRNWQAPTPQSFEQIA
ncbi:restriction endonuclease subunit S [Vibrio fluvialis]|nr:restriction endonuclease subunit S [Vibrio fluvialis]MBY7979748.1 restriction endonuclease subunit S [Vibrio fluvialis]